jgi:hypothetical protein
MSDVARNVQGIVADVAEDQQRGSDELDVHRWESEGGLVPNDHHVRHVGQPETID